MMMTYSTGFIFIAVSPFPAILGPSDLIWQEDKDNYYEETYEAHVMGRCLEILTLEVGINTGQCQQIICKNAPDIFL